MCAHANSDFSLEAAAGMLEHGRSPRERAVPLAQWAGTMSFHVAWTEPNQRGGARTRCKRVLRFLPRERERARWRFFILAHVRK